MNDIRVIRVPDGGNPRTEYDIVEQGNSVFLRPFSEDDDGNYRFRLNVEVINTSNDMISVPFIVEWGDSEHQEHRNYLLLGKDENWRRFAADINGTQSSAIVDVPPGNSFLCMHPSYSYQHYLNVVDKLSSNRLKPREIGKSRRQRSILAIEAIRTDSRPVAVLARVHPYETIGSYLVNGMLERLNGDATLQGESTSDVIEDANIIFVPMPNPDGVVEGTCKRTLGGLNFEAGFNENTAEPEGVAVRDYLLEVNPSVIIDLHGWMYGHDIILTNDVARGAKFHRTLSAWDGMRNRAVSIMYGTYPHFGREKNIGGYLANKLDAVYFDTSWSWEGRTIGDVKELGVYLLRTWCELYR